MNTLKLTYGAARSATLSVVLAVLLTLWAEFSAPFKGMLAGVSGHHWTTKSYAVVLFFLIVWGLFSRRKTASEKMTARAISLLMWTVLAGIVVVVGFYWWHSI